jgi:hypothetical protein
MTAIAYSPFVTLIATTPGAVLCVLCEGTTYVPLAWQSGSSACCRHCYRAHKRACASATA